MRKQRWIKLQNRHKKVLQLKLNKAPLRQTLWRVGAKSAFVYGMDVYGVSPDELDRLRSMARSASHDNTKDVVQIYIGV